MSWFARNPVFYLSLGLLFAAALGGMVYTSQDSDRLAELKEDYKLKEKQLQLFLKRQPAPTKANLAVLERNLERLQAEFERSKTSLNLNTYDKKLFFGDPPRDSNTAFFAIARYIEDARQLARSSSVRLGEDYRFGFHEFRNVGPSAETRAFVHKQMKIMEALIQALFDSEISEFVSIKRERPDEGGDETPDSPLSEDYFSFGGRSLVKSMELYDSLAFQLEFQGQSNAVRKFLNRINGSSLPFSISEIEVRLENESGSVEERAELLDNPFLSATEDFSNVSALRIPIISENESRFVVTLEFLEIATEGIAVGDTAGKGGNV